MEVLTDHHCVESLTVRLVILNEWILFDFNYPGHCHEISALQIFHLGNIVYQRESWQFDDIPELLQELLIFKGFTVA